MVVVRDADLSLQRKATSEGRIPFGTESKIMVVIGRSNIMDTFDGGQYCGQFQEIGGICRGSSRQASAKPCFWERVSLVEKNVKLCWKRHAWGKRKFVTCLAPEQRRLTAAAASTEWGAAFDPNMAQRDGSHACKKENIYPMRIRAKLISTACEAIALFVDPVRANKALSWRTRALCGRAWRP